VTCKIIAQASSRYSAKYRVQAAGRVYEARVKDLPGENCTVHIDGLEEGSKLFQSIKGAVLKDWLGPDAVSQGSDRAVPL
jgi:hypothetical protein